MLVSSLPHAPTLFQLTTIAQQLRSKKLESFLRNHMASTYLDTATSSGVLLQGIKVSDGSSLSYKTRNWSIRANKCSKLISKKLYSTRIKEVGSKH